MQLMAEFHCPDRKRSLNDLKARRDYLRRRCENWVNWVDGEKTRSREHLIDGLRYRLIDPYHRKEMVGGNQEALLKFFEGNWANPFQAGKAAEIVGQIVWLEGDRPRAVRIMSRYGVSSLEKLVDNLSRSRYRACIDDVIDALLVHGRWTSEWMSRFKALPAVQKEMSAKHLERIPGWIDSCSAVLEAAKEKNYFLLRGGGMSQVGDIQDSERFASLVLGRWRYLNPDVVIEEWNILVEGNQGDELVSEVAAGIGGLPWEMWIRDGLDDKIAQRVLCEAIDRLQEKDVWRNNGVFRILGEAAYLVIPNFTPWSPVIKDGTVLKKRVREWLDRSPAEAKVRERYLDAILYYKIEFSESEEEKVKIALQAIAETYGLLDEKMSYPSRRNDMIQTVTACVHYAAASKELIRELTLLLTEIRSRLERADSGAKDEMGFERNYNRDCARMAAYLGSEALIANLGEKADTVAYRVLNDGIDSSPWAVEYAAAVPVSRLPSEIVNRIDELVDWSKYGNDCQGMTRSDLQHRVVGICWQRVLRNPEDSLEQDWVEQLCTFTGADDQLLAQNACAIIELAIRSGKLPAKGTRTEDLHQIMLSLVFAARDPRGAVVGSAAAAIVHMLSVFPEMSDDLQPSLERLRNDSREEVLFKIREAEARVRTLKPLER